MNSRNKDNNIITKSLTDDKELNNKVNKDNSEINNIKNNAQDINIIKSNSNNSMRIHPLDFYTLGKVHDPPIYTSKFCSNNAFQSTSNDLLTRNMFSVNSYKYDNLRNNKNNAKLSQQNIDENNYLKPLEIFKAYKKYSLGSNVVNKETYNISKEKLFAKSNLSSIKKGLNITYNEFMNYKNRLLTENSAKNIYNTFKDKIKDKNLQRTKTQTNYKLNNKSDVITNKLVLDNINNINNINDNKVNKPRIKYVNPNDFTKKQLTSNFFYFDKNNKQFMRHKNWWIPDK